MNAEVERKYKHWRKRNYLCSKKWKAAKIDWLVITESPPFPRNRKEWKNPRYVYCLRKGRKGGLLLSAVARAFFGARIMNWSGEKRLKRLRQRGVFVLDVCQNPVDQLSDGERSRAWSDALSRSFFVRIRRMHPKHIVVVGMGPNGEFSRIVTDSLARKFGGRVVNMDPIPFPLYGSYERCWRGIRRCVDHIHQ